MTNIKKQTWSLSFCGIILVIKDKKCQNNAWNVDIYGKIEKCIMVIGISSFTKEKTNARLKLWVEFG